MVVESNEPKQEAASSDAVTAVELANEPFILGCVSFALRGGPFCPSCPAASEASDHLGRACVGRLRFYDCGADVSDSRCGDSCSVEFLHREVHCDAR